MTFEEFLIKKKIDLAQLKVAEPVLFSEFQSHYGQMGEKSFDHSKKFLFNKLRRAYHLKEEPKPLPAKEVIKVNELASQAGPLLSPTVEATVYTPRFKPAAAKPPTEPQESTGSIPAEQPKPAFKPRFKPGLTSSSTEAKPAEESVKEETPTATTPKPAYTPRFKAAVTTAPTEKPADQKPEEDNKKETLQTSDLGPQASEEQAKPAYKPRFKPSIVKAKDEE